MLWINIKYKTVNIPRKPDDLFHSDVTHEEVKKPRFNPATLSDMTTPTPRPNTRSATSVSDGNTARSVEFTAVRHPSKLLEIGPEKYVIGVT
ncbi:uncharacterized protein LOC127874668 isoform X2 [Dreissena polymorpha]|uniref:uncharacterized protein LOC127874668 isoform X2 n=1 Tax=Dreissena polymorpha TaxID=45954 RepID=UPI0022654C2D|nr:uncharacterized protein LOC127874668 isoform X2 [Dreissena polymorpha]